MIEKLLWYKWNKPFFCEMIMGNNFKLLWTYGS